ncbi:DsbA family protein [Corynebacterium pacaense]|uniref:DsbA family protein n=1 Tax=Corynebacterium pacaense TaxID=1816684 RepID=UPI0009BBCC56|nr:thioredoxin domain-containing protein [Corynebacterium pacaense]
MSTKVQNPNQGSKGFLWALVAIVVIAAVVVGYIVISSRGSKTEYVADREFENVTMNAELSGDYVTLSSDNAAADAPRVELYEDFSCPHCATLAENTDDDMLSEIEAGNLVVQVHPLNFLDRGNTDGHSTHSLAAILSVADTGDASLYWNYRTLLLEDQADIVNKWSEDDFASAAESMGADSSVVESIRNGENLGRANDIATANAEHLEETTGSLSSPRVLRDGKDVEVDDINQWIPAVLNS